MFGRRSGEISQVKYPSLKNRRIYYRLTFLKFESFERGPGNGFKKSSTEGDRTIARVLKERVTEIEK
jgi:hypothetical protein